MIYSLTKFCLLIVLTTFCQAAQAEVIDRFSADYSIEENGLVKVVETITYNFQEETQHGIFREILNKHPQAASSWYKKRSISLVVTSVKRNGVDEPYVVDYSGQQLDIKIGDAEVLVTGIQTYVITYELVGALSYGDQGAEFYYNVTGSDWEVPIKLVVATVRGDVLSGNFYCYQGVPGSTAVCTNSMKDNGVITFTTNNLVPGTGLTIATALDTVKVAKVVNEKITWLLFGYVLGAGWVIALMIYTYRFRKSNYVYQTVVAQYEPYKNFLPMYTGYLFDNQLDPRDITAGILYLAEQGFIKIAKTTRKVLLIIPTDDYHITLLRPLSEVPTKFLSQVSELLFVQSTAVGTMVPLSKLAQERSKNSQRILSLRSDLATDLQDNGFLESTSARVIKTAPRVLISLVLVFGGFILVPNGIVLVILVFVATLVFGLVMMMPKKTISWYEAKNHTEGFKLFLSVTDKERFDFHNAPEKSPELFMKYLPYAVALKVEEKWSAVFSDITIPQPDWYEGGNIAAFSASTLTKDLGAFSTALSTNSGVSGSSGGGSSGGGGGGGGGGSW